MTKTKNRPGAGAAPGAAKTIAAVSPSITTDELSRYPLVFASAFAPCGRRKRHLIVTAACPFDGGRHVHLVPDLEHAGGARRAGCGRGTYWLVIARQYATKPLTEAAA